MTTTRTLTAPKHTSTPREQITPDSYPARLISFIYLGTQIGEFNGKKTERIKIRLGFEFPTEKRVFKEGEGELPFLLSREFTFSMFKSGQLKPAVEAMIGKALTQEEADSFNILSLVGEPYFVTVIHNEKGYADIQNIMKLPKSMECPGQIIPTQIILQEDWEKEWDNIPQFVQDKIKKSKEYKELSGGDITAEDWDSLNDQEV